MDPARWIPVEWPAEWTAPDALARLAPTPFNCLLLAMKASAEFRAAAQAKEIELIEPGDARLPWRALKEIDWKKGAGILAVKDGFWPQITTRRNDSEGAGPTGAAWLDSNSWIYEMARGRAPGRPVWLRTPLDENWRMLRDESFLLPVVEASVFGGRTPFPAPAARWSAALMERVGQTVSWLEKRREWGQWQPVARLLVMSDFAAANEYMATEVLTLAARRNLPFVAVEPRAFGASSLAGRKGMLYLDPAPFSAAALPLVRKFVEGGGTLLCLRAAGAALAAGRKPGPEENPRFDVFPVGRGRVAVSKADWEDPWVLAGDAHLLMSRRWDPVRLFNAGSLLLRTSASPDGRRWAVQLLNYSVGMQSHNITVQALARVRSAKLHRMGSAAPEPLERLPGTQHAEFAVPPFQLYSAVELDLEPNAPPA